VVAEAVYEFRVEFGAASGAKHVDRSVNTIDPMQWLDIVRDLDDPHDASYLISGQPGRGTLTIPALERLLQGVTHFGAEA